MYTYIIELGKYVAIRLFNIADNKLILRKEAVRYKLSDIVAQMDVGGEPNLLLNDDPKGAEIL